MTAGRRGRVMNQSQSPTRHLVGTRTMDRFGYFEISARLMNSSSIKSAFWLNQVAVTSNALTSKGSGTMRSTCSKLWLAQRAVAVLHVIGTY